MPENGDPVHVQTLAGPIWNHTPLSVRQTPRAYTTVIVTRPPLPTSAQDLAVRSHCTCHERSDPLLCYLPPAITVF